MSNSKLWERQPWDTDASYARFVTYYLPQEPPRTLSAAYRLYWVDTRTADGLSEGEARAQAEKKTPNGTWWKWYRAQDSKEQPKPGAVGWEDRANAYDDEQTSLALRKLERDRHRVRVRTAEVGGKLREKAEEALDLLGAEELDAWSLARLIEVGSKLERLAYGDPTENVAVNGLLQTAGAGELAELEEDELDNVIERMLKVDSRFKELEQRTSGTDDAGEGA